MDLNPKEIRKNMKAAMKDHSLSPRDIVSLCNGKVSHATVRTFVEDTGGNPSLKTMMVLVDFLKRYEKHL